MSKLLQDNGYALTLGGLCLLFSAWLYVYGTPREQGALDQAANRPAAPSDAVAQDGSKPAVVRKTGAETAQAQAPRLGPRRKPSTEVAERVQDKLGDQQDPLDFAIVPTDWRNAPYH